MDWGRGGGGEGGRGRDGRGGDRGGKMSRRKTPGNGERRGEREQRWERALEPLGGETEPVTRTPCVPAPLIPQGRSFFLYAEAAFDVTLLRRPLRMAHPLSTDCLMLLLTRFPLPVVSPPPKPEYLQWELPPSCLMMPSSLYQQEAAPFSFLVFS